MSNQSILSFATGGGALVVETLTGNSGGAVGPTANNINVVGDGTTVTVAGNAGTSTLTISTITGGQVVNVTPISTTYTTLSTDYVIAATTSSSYTVSLIASPATGRSYRIKDVSGTAGTNNLVISGNGANIDGAATYTINQNYGSIDVTFTGSIWSIL